MRSHRLMAVLLAGVWIFGTGATMEGVREARRWQHAAQIAAAVGNPEIAYIYYEKVASTFPGTPHGREAACQGWAMQTRLHAPAHSPASESAAAWIGEMVDFLTWP